MQFNHLLEQKLYLIVAIILALFCLTIDFDSFGLSKTVGTAYELGNIAKTTCLASLLFSFIGYAILSLLGYKTQKFLSLVYLSDMLPAILLSYTKAPVVSIFFGVMSIIVSCINIIRSLKVKSKI